MNLSELVQVYGSNDSKSPKADEKSPQVAPNAKKASVNRAGKPKRADRNGAKSDKRQTPVVFAPPPLMPAIPGSYPSDPSYAHQYAPPMVRNTLFYVRPF